MIGHLHVVTDDEIQRFLADLESVRPVTRWWEPTGRPHLSIDKAWHGLHFLLTGNDWGGSEKDDPLDFLLTGGAEIDLDDVAHDRPRIFTNSQTTDISAALENISADALRGRFNPNEMYKQDIYPNIWDRDPAEDDTLGYLMHFWEPLKQFVADAARAGSGLLVYIS